MCCANTQNAQKQNTKQTKKTIWQQHRKIQYKGRIETKNLNSEKQR